MTTRRPQDPRTRRIPDEEAVVPTLSPGGATVDPGATVMPDPGATVMPDPGATVMPVDQRHVETVDPSATVLPEGLEAPKPRAQRGGGVVRGGAATIVERTMTADSLEAVRQQVRAKADAEAKASGTQKKTKAKKRQGAGWGTWVVAFLLLGGVGFGVAWLIMNPPGGAGESVAAAAPTEDAAASTGGDGAGEDAAAAAAEDAAEQADAQAAATPDTAAAPDTAADTMVAAAADGALAAAGASDAAEAADAVAQAEVAPDAAAAKADAAPAGAEVQVAQADAAPSPAPDATPTSPDAAVAIVDAQAPEVAPAPKPFIANPIEAARLNEDGLARRKAGDNAGAMRYYEQALAADPDHVWSRYNLACELALAGRGKEALAGRSKLHKLGTGDARRALQAARKDSDFRSIKDNGQFFRLTNF